MLTDFDAHLIAEGQHMHLYDRLGAHPGRNGEPEGVSFAVWAPNARACAVVGDFNDWDPTRDPMRVRYDCGVWETFVPGAREGQRYKFALRGPDGNALPLKADPFAFAAELRPATASVIAAPPRFAWSDDDWIANRKRASAADGPVTMYEAHLGSWRRGEGGRFLSYRELAAELLPYVRDMGFTHVELLPVHEHPFDGSWGYQPIGLFTPTSRYGTPEDFCFFVDRAHALGIGVVVDWVAGHFPGDGHGLRLFDGTHLYEHADPRQGYHPDWSSYIYNYGRREVRNFLIANALFWCERFHVDGLRVDAVASMLYLDYSRRPGEWVPNAFGGRENLDAIAFLRSMNEAVAHAYPGVLVVAEESTAWPQVTGPAAAGGLGFSYKWNMGWMHDTLRYFKHDPVHRRFHHDLITFGLMYAWDEHFVLPLSHDEVVHMKGSILRKAPGDRWQQFANVRMLYGLMYAHPGKKLLFMGNEFAQDREWNHDGSLDWHLLDEPLHSGIASFVRDCNALARSHPALHADRAREGFSWIDPHDELHSIFAFMRRAPGGERAVIVVNATPVVRDRYRLGVPEPGVYRELLNSDSAFYGGSNVGNLGALRAEEIPAQGMPYSLELVVPPLAVLIIDVP